MEPAAIPRATLGRLPMYLHYIRASVREKNVSAAAIARGLGLGEVQVRKDLSLICKEGRPRVGYTTEILLEALENVLGVRTGLSAVIVGAGKLGRALMRYDGFSIYGLEIAGAFDLDPVPPEVLPMEELSSFCTANGVHIGILTVPAEAAQRVCDEMVRSGITAIWNFAPVTLNVPAGVTVRQEDLALSLAHLVQSSGGRLPGGEPMEE